MHVFILVIYKDLCFTCNLKGYIMEIEIDKNSRIPLYLQIKDQIKKLRFEGQLEKGSQVPTERELSAKLNVSRNTVSMAYKELAQEKILSSTSGKGTFVIAEDYYRKSSNFKQKNSQLIKQVDQAIQTALNLNLDSSDFLNLVKLRITEKKKLQNNVRIAFVECNQEQLYYFSKKLELGTGIHIIPILIDKIYNHPEDFVKEIKQVDLVVTTFFHLQEVQNFLQNENKKIIAIALDPQIETMVNIAGVVSSKMRIGLICLTEKFADRVLRSLKNSGIKFDKFSYTTSHNTEELKEFINLLEILIVSPGRKKEAKKLLSKKIPLIEFIYIPDKGSIDTLKKTIFDIKKVR